MIRAIVNLWLANAELDKWARKKLTTHYMALHFTLKELNPNGYTLTEEQTTNLTELIKRVSIIREAYGKSFVVNSGVRSMEDQMHINPKAPKSNHLGGAAMDISDRSGNVKAWLLKNVKLLESAGLWCEHFDDTPTWVHFQIFPPKSGNRFFHP